MHPNLCVTTHTYKADVLCIQLDYLYICANAHVHHIALVCAVVFQLDKWMVWCHAMYVGLYPQTLFPVYVQDLDVWL